MTNPLIDTENLTLYDQLIKAVAGGSLSLSDDGKKLVLKSVDGTILSQVDAPSSGGGASGGSADVSNLIPKTGNRGVLAGYEAFVSIAEDFGTVAIAEDTPDISLAYAVVAPNSTFQMEDTGTEIRFKSMTKVVMFLYDEGSNVILDTNWFWKDNTFPTFSTVGLLIFHIPPFFEPMGFVTYVPLFNG